METTFSDWLRDKLAQNNWSQADLANKSGVSPAQITRVLSGERGLGINSLVAIAKALQVSPSEIFRATGLLPPTITSTENQETLIYLFSQLPDDVQKNVIRYVQLQLEIYSETKKQ